MLRAIVTGMPANPRTLEHIAYVEQLWHNGTPWWAYALTGIFLVGCTFAVLGLCYCVYQEYKDMKRQIGG